MVFGQRYGLQKPDPRLFEIALQRAGCCAQQAVHVGDSIEADVLGARRAGIASIWLNRQSLRNDTGAEPDYEITSLAELLTLCGL